MRPADTHVRGQVDSAAGRVSALMVLVIAVLAACTAPGPLVGASSSAPSPTTSASASASPSASPTPSGSAAIVSRDTAIKVARAAAQRWGDGDLLNSRLVRYGTLDIYIAAGATPPAKADDLVWWISLGYDPGPLMAQGEFFVIDAHDGHLVTRNDWMS